ncbi:PAS domain S-box-containing protein [Marmoricola sp. URHA0025 HA25]
MASSEPGILEPFGWSPVLIVDDDPSSALLALKLLLRAGLRRVDTINDARQVMDWVDEHDPDLILLDLHMPYLDGFGVLTALRERSTSTDLPVIVLTADDTLDASDRALGLGANDFLVKPLQPTALTHRARNLLDMRAAHRSLHRRQRWLEEAERFSRELFSGEIDEPLLTMASRSLQLADADHVLTMDCRTGVEDEGCLSTPQQWVDQTTAGVSGRLTIGLGQRLRAQVVEKATPVLIDDGRHDPDLVFEDIDEPEIGPMMLLPVAGTETPRAVVGLVRDAGREPYSPSDLETAQQFVTRAAIALELVDRRADRKSYLDFFEILVSQVTEYAIVRLDVDGRVASWNVGAERVQGYSAEDAVGRHLSLFHPDEDVRAGVPQRLLDEAGATGRAHHQGWGVRKDGTRFWGEASLTALRDERGVLIGYAQLTRDMTESRRLELARESFFASLSHDLRTPLNSIQGFVEMIPIVDEHRRGEFIERVQSNVGRLTVLIDNLLDHARLRAGAVPLSPEVVHAATVATSCVRDLSPLLGEHRVVVEDSDLSVVADPAALGRVLANLLVNAVRYSPAGTPIEVTFEEDAPVGRIVVTDHGRGIAKADLATIFDEFERGSLAEPDGGTGLGLSSVRQLVTLQDGTVWIASEPGFGTTVSVELPLPGTGQGLRHLPRRAMNSSTPPSQRSESAGERPDQDAEPPGPGIPGPIHPDEPAEGPDTPKDQHAGIG